MGMVLVALIQEMVRWGLIRDIFSCGETGAWLFQSALQPVDLLVLARYQGEVVVGDSRFGIVHTVC